MKFRIPLLTFVFSALSVSAFAQCSNATQKPSGIRRRAAFNVRARAQKRIVQPVGDKELCASARQNLEAACPAANDGKACQKQAKSIYNTLHKEGKEAIARTAQSSGKQRRKDRLGDVHDDVPAATAGVQRTQAAAAGSRSADISGYVPAGCFGGAEQVPGEQSLKDSAWQSAVNPAHQNIFVLK